MMFHKSESSGLDIAIIGMAGRFPGAPDVDAFWKNVQDGIESIHQYTDQELRDLGVSEELINDPDYVKAGIPFEGKDLFDTEFFGYTPRDAARIDPQQRVFLESAWHAIEHAGYAAQFQKDRIGVYAGAGTSYYLLRHLMPSQPVDQGAGITELLGLMSGNSADSLATRVAYKLGLRGPAVTVQTACSTSLTSVHMACQALLGNECDMALAGGVSLNLLQKGGYRYQQGAILSPDGHCRAFDAKAGGTLVGSGVALVVLKRLEDALRDGDTIHAIIKGSAANNDGADKAGYTAPSISGQTAVIRAALAMADVSADSIGLIEAHGTGTTLGDPIEIAALTEAFRHDTNRHGYCAIGSVKTNVGHLDAAAGVTGLIKAALSVRDGVLPASLNFESPNPKIDFENSPFKVNTETRPWPPDAWPRRAGVSSFGIGGTNVHVVLEEPPSSEVIRNQRPQNPLHERADPDQKARLLMLSAQNEAALADIARELAAWLDRHPSVSLPDVSRTLRVGRGAFRHRLGIVANTVSEAVKALRTLAPDGSTAAKALEAPSVAFLFPGQGAQHPGMARALYEQDDAFRETVDRCCTLLKPELGLDLRTLLVADGDQGDLTARLAQTAITQPALFVIEYAMAQWWIGQGIRPDAMIGHSVGEYAAACVSGVFSLEDALRLMAARGRLLQATNAGAMLAVSEAESALKQVMPAGCDLAAVNAPDLCVLAGTVEAIEQAEQQLSSQGVGVRRLMVSHAFHSVLVEPMLARFEAFLNQVRLSPPGIPFISNLSGRWITADEACSPAYWCQHVRGTVRFENGLKTLMEKQTRMLLEVGPGETLATLARRHPAVGQRQVLSSQCHPQRVAQNAVQPLRCLAQMWSRGVDVSNAPLLQEPGARRIPLPGYPFQRQSYWIDAVEDAATPSGMQEPDRRGNGQIASSPSGWLHHPVWQRALPLTVPRDAVAVSGPIVVFGEDDVLTQVLVEQTTSLTREVIRVMPGTGFERVATNTYRVMSGDRQEMKKLWQAMETDHGRPAHVVHLWCLDSPGRGRESMPLDRGFHTLLALVQAIDDLQSAGEASPLSITIVANGIEDVTGLEPLCPEKATLQGIRLVVPQEYPHVRCALIDVINPDTADDALRLSQQVLAEILVRTVAATGFRAPSVAELYGGNSGSFDYLTNPWLPLSEQTGQILVNRTSDPDLKPEESESYTAGLVYSPNYIDGMSITLDYWRFKVTDAIARADVQVGLDACHAGDAEACSTFNITADGDLFNLTSALTNVGSQDTSGIDFNLAYNFELFGLDWKVSNDTTYLIKFEQDGENYTGTIDGNMGAYARVRNNFSISAGQDDWSIMYFNRYIRSMTDVYTDYDANDNPFVAARGVDSILYHNISGTYHVTDNTTVSLGVKNLTDEKPLYVTNGSDAGTVPEVYDTIGRTIYGGVTVKF